VCNVPDAALKIVRYPKFVCDVPGTLAVQVICATVYHHFAKKTSPSLWGFLWNFVEFLWNYSVHCARRPAMLWGMGRIIRRTVIITITETVTITWATGGDPLSHPSIIVQDELTPKEEADGALQTTASDVPPKANVGSQHKRTRRRHAAGNQPST